MADQLHSKAGITWGKVLGGAAMAVGAVVAVTAVVSGANVGTGEGSVFASIGDGIRNFVNWVASGFKGDKPPVAEFLGTNTGKGLIGAATLGGGYALLSHSRGKEEENQDYARGQSVLANQAEGFAMREQMRAMQGVMKARMAMTSPEYAAAEGRGA